jgi:hypothetical protein
MLFISKVDGFGDKRIHVWLETFARYIGTSSRIRNNVCSVPAGHDLTAKLPALEPLAKTAKMKMLLCRMLPDFG